MRLNILQAMVEMFTGRARARVGLRSETQNQSSTATASTVQSAIRAAEGGETRQLFALYRDLCLTGSHVQTELGKRKLAVLGQAWSVLPEDKEDKADEAAAAAVDAMISGCENWTEGLGHLLDGTIWPVAVAEKVWVPAEKGSGFRYGLKRLEPVNPCLLCLRQPYGAATIPSPQPSPQGEGGEQWERDLRFYKNDEAGNVDYSYATSYAAEPGRHVVHRGHLLTVTRDCWGGPMRAIVFWWMLSALGRDWFGRFIERYGMPFVVGHTDTTNAEGVSLLQTAFSESTRIGGLVVDHGTQIELMQVVASNGADAYERFLNVCNREISKVVLGQSSSVVQATGLGSGVSEQQERVRDDVRMFDAVRLGETVRRQIFSDFLRINGLPGRPPRIIWGGESGEDAAETAGVLVSLSQAGLEPTDEALPTLSERVGFEIQRKAMVSVVPNLPAENEENADGNLAAKNAKNAEDAEGAIGEVETLRAEVPRPGHPSGALVAAQAKALGAAFRGSLAPIKEIILASKDADEARANVARFFSDWNGARVASVVEEALQVCAAAGAGAGRELTAKNAENTKNG